MKLIRPSTEILCPSGYHVNDIYRFITQVAYTCYKTDKPITNDSAKEFVNRLVKSGHMAMLEHGTVYLRIPYSFIHRAFHPGLVSKYINNKYTKVNIGSDIFDGLDSGGNVQIVPYAYITTNMRAVIENHWEDDLIKYICEPCQGHDIRRTVKFITDRGVSHELVRHRNFSFAQESTRYCNYSKDKFGNEITFIEPTWYDMATDKQKQLFNDFLSVSEEAYMALLDKWENRVPDRRYKTKLYGNPLTPQQARQVLPNALKTEIVLTAFESDWVHFFNLRALGLTGKPHPDMLNLAEPLFSQFLEKFPTFTKKFNEVHSKL